ncbi:ABC transporter ATP-binding protein [Sinorhizobium meliloti]|uniref:amino acid ABC transporter ATP-binding protein n=1 Tax=Rhizobium meliloti TaxID=382 RepID=UPI000EFAC77D|nr:amino acid ABC transporter ATP-binding protein [Sinorhizobium meliloti]RMC65030.1 amino acid ABC transporter ATP-binding protein [Sinorhizobium meliloti]RVO43548.1 ABC transporter ATP-binding protein [Sinorhizobium meliloti]UIJ91997.1 amino acid ABC transporter ATP-binding protein [Sinorhizobium meliloti]WKL28354.1 amino acid ABC transporter ATP-binding protein [Sinorhizobium meliloti]WKL33915.1 amino acid ABC transporter ATP-binding protein [Sinorhizobium meliloti]
MTFFAARDANLHFGKFHVLRDISLEFEKSQVMVICGPSGSGKSTLIRSINRLAGPLTSGSILLEGRDLKSMSAKELHRRIGMVFQRFNLFQHLTVLDNIALPQRRVLGRSRKEAKARAVSLLERVGLKDKCGAYPVQLSGGQQQRVAICRALAMDPELLLFDEPTSALDPEMVGEVLQVMRELASSGMTMIVVTHEMGFARELASEILFMEEGRIVERAPPAEFFSEPREQRTRTFLQQILRHGG